VLDDPRFGPLKGQTVSLLCGGTLVFDGRGNVLHFTHKPGFEDVQYREAGEQRRDCLLDYVARLVDAGIVGLMEDEGDELGIGTPPVAAWRANGRLYLEVSPHLRHLDEDWRRKS
jgi:hypothetical protein